MSIWLVGLIGILYIFATISLALDAKYGEAIMCLGSVIFTSGLLAKIAGY